MDVQQDLRISQLIPSIKCSDCGETVEFRRLGDHNCKGAPAIPIIPSNYQNSSIKSPSPTRPVNNVPVSSPFSSTPRPNLNPLSVPAGYGYDNGRSRSPHDNASSPTDSGYSGYSGNSKYSPATPVTPATPTPKSFLQKYEQITGKQINSPQTPRNVPLAENNYNANGNVNGFGDKYTTPYDNKFTQPNKPRDPYGQAYPVDRGISDPRKPPNNDRPYDYGYNQPPLFNDNVDFLDDPYRAARPKVPNDPRPDFMRNQNPNDRYNNSNNDYMRNRSPTSNDGNKYRPPPSSTNQPYGQSPYDYAGSRMSPRPPQEKNGVPGIPPQSQPQQPYSKPYTPINPVYNNNNNKDNLESRRYDQGDRKDTSNPYAVNGVGLDDMMDDLLREMNNMQTSSQSEKENSNTRDICAYCKTEITSSSTALWAVGKAWHSNHLLCAHCRKPIDPNVGHVEKDDKVYCPKDFADLFLPKCRRCNLPVEREAVSASDGKLQGKWHVKCFVCHTCYKPFPNKSFYVFDNAPYCKLHYHKLNNSLCKNCNDPIEGPCAQTVEGWRYHPNCFVCFVSGCQTPLTDIYYSFETRQYCETHIMEIQRRRKIQPEKRRTIFHNI